MFYLHHERCDYASEPFACNVAKSTRGALPREGSIRSTSLTDAICGDSDGRSDYLQSSLSSFSHAP